MPKDASSQTDVTAIAAKLADVYELLIRTCETARRAEDKAEDAAKVSRLIAQHLRVSDVPRE